MVPAKDMWWIELPTETVGATTARLPYCSERIFATRSA